jgi:hypothetical protein
MMASDTSDTASQGAAQAAPDRSTTFQPVEGGGEHRSGETLLVEGYAVLWILLMGWLLFQWRRQGALNARIDGLEQAIDRAAAKVGSGAGAKR